MDDLEKLLAEEEKETPATPSEASEEKPKEDEKEKETEKEEEEVLKKQEHLANLQKAIEEANTELSRVRGEAKKAKTSEQLEEEDVPKIDMSDPSSKAWNKHISQSVRPVQEELEKEKAEVRNFALQKFLADKPRLAKNTEKVKELIATYEKIRTASERTQEGVLLDLQRAYGATFHEELLQAARQERIDQAKADSIYSDIAVSKGATAYQNKTVPDESAPKTADERDLARQWDKTLGSMGIK